MDFGLDSTSSLTITNVNSIYEDVLKEESVLDLSFKELDIVPPLRNDTLTALYLESNMLTSIPPDFFLNLPSLMWLDLRDNQLTAIPATVKGHPCLTHLLLQNNKITALPNELGTLPNLVVLQLGGNPIIYPPKDIISEGTQKILSYLCGKCYEETLSNNDSLPLPDPKDLGKESELSYNSVLIDAKIRARIKESQQTDSVAYDSDEEYFSRARYKVKCPRYRTYAVPKPVNTQQSSKYLKPRYAPNKREQSDKMHRSFFKERALANYKEKLAAREKILQSRKNVDSLKNWRKQYLYGQITKESGYYEPEFPYDTDPKCMAVLSREDIERDLPDKYRKKLVRRGKRTLPRKSTNDLPLANKMKELCESLAMIDLNQGPVSPRTEQKRLLSEIQKITQIQQSLTELSTVSIKSVPDESIPEP